MSVICFSSLHPLSMKQSVMGSLLHRVDYISEEGTIAKEKEVSHVMSVLQVNGYLTACLESWRKEKSSAARNVARKEDRRSPLVCHMWEVRARRLGEY